MAAHDTRLFLLEVCIRMQRSIIGLGRVPVHVLFGGWKRFCKGCDGASKPVAGQRAGLRGEGSGCPVSAGCDFFASSDRCETFPYHRASRRGRPCRPMTIGNIADRESCCMPTSSRGLSWCSSFILLVHHLTPEICIINDLSLFGPALAQ